VVHGVVLARLVGMRFEDGDAYDVEVSDYHER